MSLVEPSYRQATLLNCVPLDGSEPDAKVETLSTEHISTCALEAYQGVIDRTAGHFWCL